MFKVGDIVQYKLGQRGGDYLGRKSPRKIKRITNAHRLKPLVHLSCNEASDWVARVEDIELVDKGEENVYDLFKSVRVSATKKASKVST